MALNLEDKKAIVAEVADVAAKSLSAVAADYRGLTVSEMTELRAKARKSDVYLRVVRNTLAKRAVENTNFSCLQEKLSGPLMLAFCQDEPGKAARLVRDFAKGNDKLEVKALVVGDELYDADALDRVAKLPTRDEAIALLMSAMNAPAQKLVRTMAEIPAQLVRTLNAIGEQKQSA